MFFEVCLVSFGLFAGSELVKKIRCIVRNEPYRPSRLKIHHNKEFQNQPSDKTSIRWQEKTAEIKNISDIDGKYTDIRTALDTLTAEVSQMREELAKLQKTKTEIPVKMIQAVINEPSEGSGYHDKSLIFKQIIEDNVKLRNVTL